jgi:energy-coupling factor transport system permease protein
MRPWHRTDPRARLLATIACSGVLLAAATWSTLAIAALALAALLASSGTPPARSFAALRPFRFLLLLTAAVQLFFTPGDPLLPGLLPEAATREGAAAGAQALLRLAGVIVLSAHLIATTSPLDLARGLGWMIAPLARLGLPVRDATLVTALAFQFFPVLLDEGRQVRSALEARGISLAHPRLRLRARALFVWILAVLFGMVDRSLRLALALEAKGFGRSRHLRHRFPPWTPESTALLGASAALLAAVLLR